MTQAGDGGGHPAWRSATLELWSSPDTPSDADRDSGLHDEDSETEPSWWRMIKVCIGI